MLKIIGLARLVQKNSQFNLKKVPATPIFDTILRTYTAQRASKSPTRAAGDVEEVNNEPIKYFGSEAASWRARDTRSGGSQEALWYQPYVISISLAVFLVYFCVLREESDIDLKLEGNLYEHVNGMEEVALTVNYKYNKEHGLDNKQIEQRLRELGVDLKQLDKHIAAH